MTKPSLLVIDDSVELIHVVGKLLESHFEIAAATQLTEALGLVKANSPDVILLDIELGLESGFSLLKKIEEVSVERSIPVILFSAHFNALLYQKGLSLGARGFIQKPINADLLAIKVQKLMAPALLKKRCTSFLLIGKSYPTIEPIANHLFIAGCSVEIRGSTPVDPEFLIHHRVDHVVFVDVPVIEDDNKMRRSIEDFLALPHLETLCSLLATNISSDEECWAYRAGVDQVIPYQLLSAQQLAVHLVNGVG